MSRLGNIRIFLLLLGVIKPSYTSVPTISTVMTQGGDGRVYLLPKTGLNKYQTLPCVTPNVISRASCSSSSPSEKGFEAARTILTSVFEAEDVELAFEDAMNTVHEDIRKQVIRDPAREDSYVITTSSGSDAELLVTTVALLKAQGLKKEGFAGTVCSIMVSGGEISQASILAAGMRHLSFSTPHGGVVVKNALLAGASEDFFSTRVIQARGGVSGESVSQKDCEAKLEEVLKKVIIDERQVAVLHLVHASKLGLSMPSFSFIKKMKKRYGKALVCAVDMTQLRGNDGSVADYLAENCYVLIAASHFFAAPSFAGALLIPRSESFVNSDELVGLGAYIPEGLHAYFTAFDVDKRLIFFRDFFKKSAKNYGLLCRWTVGLCEMTRFYHYPEATRSLLVNRWVHEVRMLLLEQYNMFMLEDVFCSNENIIADNALAGTNTIISVLLLGLDDEGRGVAFSYEMLNNVIEYLLKDLSNDLPSDASAEERIIASSKVLLGSPVRLSDTYSVLRIALGAPMINAILESDDQKSAFNSIIADDATAIAKLSLVVRYYIDLESARIRKSSGVIVKN